MDWDYSITFIITVSHISQETYLTFGAGTYKIFIKEVAIELVLEG